MMNEDIAAFQRNRSKIFDLLQKIERLTITYNSGTRFSRIEPDGTISHCQNDELKRVLTPLLEDIKQANQVLEGSGTMILRKFVGRLMDTEFMTKDDLDAPDPIFVVPDDLGFRVFESHLTE